jgi:subtilisin family serine protease
VTESLDELRFLPAWGLERGAEKRVEAPLLPQVVDLETAVGAATGAGITVCVLDSGIDPDHPLVGPVDRSVTVVAAGEGWEVVDDDAGDVSGHGTACAGVIRSLAPDVRLVSVRVLGSDVNGTFDVLRAGLGWAVDQRYELLNLSLSVRRRDFALDLAELVDRATHRGTLVICSAHNTPVLSYPWQFASVVSVASHEEPDSRLLLCNPEPPVAFYARGVDVPVAWPGGGTLRATGNSFATPHVTGLLALIRSNHPRLTPSELKTLLYRAAANTSVTGF